MFCCQSNKKPFAKLFSRPSSRRMTEAALGNNTTACSSFSQGSTRLHLDHYSRSSLDISNEIIEKYPINTPFILGGATPVVCKLVPNSFLKDEMDLGKALCRSSAKGAILDVIGLDLWTLATLAQSYSHVYSVNPNPATSPTRSISNLTYFPDFNSVLSSQVQVDVAVIDLRGKEPFPGKSSPNQSVFSSLLNVYKVTYNLILLLPPPNQLEELTELFYVLPYNPSVPGSRFNAKIERVFIGKNQRSSLASAVVVYFGLNEITKSEKMLAIHSRYFEKHSYRRFIEAWKPIMKEKGVKFCLQLARELSQRFQNDEKGCLEEISEIQKTQIVSSLKRKMTIPEEENFQTSPKFRFSSPVTQTNGRMGLIYSLECTSEELVSRKTSHQDSMKPEKDLSKKSQAQNEDLFDFEERKRDTEYINYSFTSNFRAEFESHKPSFYFGLDE